MSNEKVITAFLEGENAKTPLRKIINGCYQYEGRTLYTNNNKLINYSTIIAIKDGDVILLNSNKYSRTTSKIQSMIKRLAQDKGFKVQEIEGF